MMLTLAGVRDQPLDVTSTAGLPMLSRDTPSLPALLPLTMMMGASMELDDGSSLDMVEDSLFTVITVSMFHLYIALSPSMRGVYRDDSLSLNMGGAVTGHYLCRSQNFLLL